MGTTCKLCCLEQPVVEAAFASGVSDRAIARRFNVSAMSVGRHRKLHLLKVAQDRVTLLAKDSAARQQRQELAAAAASDTPSTQALIEATLGLRRQMEKLTSIEERLERMATFAEGAGSPTGVAALAAQQFRGIETGARLAGIGGFAPAAQAGAPPRAGPVFSITMVFPSAGRQETISVVESRPAIENAVTDREDGGTWDGCAVTDED